MRAVLVARVSTDDKGQTTDSQLLPLREATRRMGWTIAKEIPLELSAWDEEAARVVRNTALHPIRGGEADVLMVWAWDRISREGIQAAFNFLGELENHLGGSFYSLQEPFLSTATATKEQRELMLALVSWAAKWESQRKSERVRAKVASKISDSAKLGQHALWGRGRMPNEQDKAVMRAQKAAGVPLRAIAKATNFGLATVSRVCSNLSTVSEAIPPPGALRRSAGSIGTPPKGVAVSRPHSGNSPSGKDGAA